MPGFHCRGSTVEGSNPASRLLGAGRRSDGLPWLLDSNAAGIEIPAGPPLDLFVLWAALAAKTFQMSRHVFGSEPTCFSSGMTPAGRRPRSPSIRGCRRDA